MNEQQALPASQEQFPRLINALTACTTMWCVLLALMWLSISELEMRWIGLASAGLLILQFTGFFYVALVRELDFHNYTYLVIGQDTTFGMIIVSLFSWALIPVDICFYGLVLPYRGWQKFCRWWKNLNRFQRY